MLARLQQCRLACGNAAFRNVGKKKVRCEMVFGKMGGKETTHAAFATLLGRSLELVRQLGQATFRGLRR